MSKRKWIYPHVKNIKGMYVLSFGLRALFMLAALAIVYTQKIVIDDILIKERYHLFAPIMGLFGISILMFMGCLSSSYYVMRKNQLHIRFSLSKQLIDHYYKMPMSEYHGERIARMTQYFSNDIRITTFFITSKVIQGGTDLLKTVVLIIVVGMSSLPILAIIVACSMLYLFQHHYFAPRLKTAAKVLLNEKANVAVTIEEGIASSREVSVFNRLKWEWERMRKSFDNVYLKAMDEANIQKKIIWIGEPLKWCGNLAVLGFGGYQVITGQLTVGVLVVLFQFSSQLIDAIHQVYSFITASSGGVAAIEHLMEATEGDNIGNGDVDIHSSIHSLRFQNVWFRYKKENKWVLKDVSLDIPIGKKVAFVGESGGGKSTIVQLLSRFYDPDSGKIVVNEGSLSEMNRHTWANKVSVVFQETYFFPDTIRNNLLMGKEVVSDKEIMDACRCAEIDKLIVDFPHGLDTLVSERASNFSGGERQRLALARALIHRPEVLILDESTSALDTETEQKIMQNIKDQYGDLTLIIIAHRMNTVMDADRIYVIDQGELVESGTHHELSTYNKQSIYQGLIKSYSAN